MSRLICERAGVIVEAFRIPFWGHVADETPPSWFISGMQSEDIFLNDFGGFTKLLAEGQIVSVPGDYVIYDGDFEFCTASEFTQSYNLLDERQAA